MTMSAAMKIAISDRLDRHVVAEPGGPDEHPADEQVEDAGETGRRERHERQGVGRRRTACAAGRRGRGRRGTRSRNSRRTPRSPRTRARGRRRPRGARRWSGTGRRRRAGSGGRGRRAGRDRSGPARAPPAAGVARPAPRKLAAKPRQSAQKISVSIMSRVATARQPFNAATSAGTTSNRSPTMPKSATSKIGASGSLLIATITCDPFIPTRCWMAPEMPSAT